MTHNPFKDLPTNYKRQYVRGTDKSGCKIYMPVDSLSDEVLKAEQAKLQAWLDNQPEPPKLVA